MAVPAALEAHLLGEDARAQLVLLAEVHEAHARALQLLDQLHLENLTRSSRRDKSTDRCLFGSRWGDRG